MIATHLAFFFFDGASTSGEVEGFAGYLTVPPYYAFDGFSDSGVTPTTPTPTPTGSSGGRYLPAPGDYGTCRREIKALENEKRKVQRKIKRIQQELEDKEDRIRFESSMTLLHQLNEALARLHAQLQALYTKLAEIESEELALIAFCINETEWLQ